MALGRGATYQVTLASRDLAGRTSAAAPLPVEVRSCGTFDSDSEHDVARACVFFGGPEIADGGGCATSPPSSIWLAALALRRRRYHDRARSAAVEHLTIER